MIITLLIAALSMLPLPAGQEIQVVPHRGLLRHAPENTLANFRACLELGMGFEFDVQRAGDGALVCIHDDTLDRTTNGKGRVADTPLASIRELDAGAWFHPRFKGERVPTVEEVLALVAAHRRKGVLVAVDLKAAHVEAEVAALAQRLGALERLLFIGRAIGEPAVRANIMKQCPKAACAALANTPADFDAALEAADASWVYFRFVPTPGLMERVHKAGKKGFIAGVTVAGVEPANWKAAAAAGIDGLLTDHPLEWHEASRPPRPKP
ncbi:MAG: hypothetical protein KJS91_05520 [Planctomycetes bacterium]|nr:hypothetical protein [Planctomycetota bacterium]